MRKYIFLVILVSGLTEAQARGYAGDEACARINKVEIRYRDYFIFYLGHNTTTDKVEKTGRFYRFLKSAVNGCCVHMELEFVKENKTVMMGSGEVLLDVEASALAVLSDNGTTPRPFVFYFPEFAMNKEKVVYDYELQFVKLARSPGPAVVMLKPSSNNQVSVLAIFKKSAAIIVFMLTLSWFFGILGWIADHWKNPDEFPSPFIIGMFEGFWWAIVTMTTVGYGDKAPKSVPARFLAVVWVMISAVVLSLFTANATSILTQSLREQDYSKTIGKKIGVFQSKDFDEFYLNLGAEVINFTNYDKMVAALKDHEIDRFLFPDYKDLMWALNNIYPEGKEMFEIAKVLEFPFQVGMVLAITPELLDVNDNIFLKCLRTAVSYGEKMEKQHLDYGSIIYKKQAKDDNSTALNHSNLFSLIYFLLIVIGCLVCCGIVWDLWKYHSKTKIRDENEHDLDIEPGNKNEAMIVENAEDKGSSLSKHDSATWF